MTATTITQTVHTRHGDLLAQTLHTKHVYLHTFRRVCGRYEFINPGFVPGFTATIRTTRNGNGHWIADCSLNGESVLHVETKTLAAAKDSVVAEYAWLTPSPQESE